MLWPDAGLYFGLFLNAFVAATLLPAFSELALASLIVSGAGAPALLMVAATSGNVLGSCLNWWIGTRLLDFSNRRWFPFSKAQLARGQRLFKRYGYASLLFAWLPVVGDPLTLAAGVFRARFGPFLLLVTLGKSLRYGLVIWAAYAAI